MTTDFVEDQVSVSPPEPEDETTRWEARPGDVALTSEPQERERGGIILAAFVALFVPLIVAGAILIPGASSSEADSTGNELESIGLDGITVAPTPTTATTGEQEDDADPSTEVAGGVEIDEGADPADQQAVESAKDETVVSDADSSVSETASSIASSPPFDQQSNPTPQPTPTPSPAVTPTTVTPVAEPSASSDPSTAAPTSATPTTAAPTPTTVIPTTAVSTTASTAAAPTTTRAPDEQPDPTAFSQRVEIGQITDTSVRYRFTAAVTSSYVAVVRDDEGIVATSTGTAVGGEEEVKSALGLMPGTDYTIRVRLLGPPEVSSVPVPFRTSGGSPAPAEVDVEVLDVTVVEVQSTRFVVNYSTNICANGSFVIREVGGTVVGRNNGQDDGCTTRHLAVPGFWTPALEPDTTYVLVIRVEADGQGRGDGNEASRTLTVTTQP